MERDPRAYLWDVREAAEAMLEFSAGKTPDSEPAAELLKRIQAERVRSVKKGMMKIVVDILA